MSVELLAALVAGVLVVNLVVAWLLIRGDGDARAFIDADAWDSADRSNAGERPGTVDRGGDASVPDGDPPPLSADCDAVVCDHCGTENRPGYRYCRWCVRSGLSEHSHPSATDASMTHRPL